MCALRARMCALRARTCALRAQARYAHRRATRARDRRFFLGKTQGKFTSGENIRFSAEGKLFRAIFELVEGFSWGVEALACACVRVRTRAYENLLRKF